MTEGETRGEAEMVGIRGLDPDERRVAVSAKALMAPLTEAFMAVPLAAVPIEDAAYDRAPRA